MLSSVCAISRRALIVASAAVLTLSTLPAAAATSLEELLELNARAWGGEKELLTQTYGPDGVHSATFYDRTHVYEGADAIAAVAGGGFGLPEAIGPRIEIPAPDGEYRWADFISLGGGSACLWHVADLQIVRHDCILPERSFDALSSGGLADGSRSAEIDELMERLDAAWDGADMALLEAVYAPDAVHSARYLNTTRTYEGPQEIYAVAGGGGEIGRIGPRVEFETPEGQLLWAEVATVAGGTVCLYRAVEGMITRHDCILPISM